MKTFTNQEIISKLKTTPAPIVRVFKSQRTADIILSFKSRYDLHIDQIDAVSKEVGNLLLGLIDPTTFIAELGEYGISSTIANSIAQDINNEIFVPLQQKMREPASENDDFEDDWVEIESESTEPSQALQTPPTSALLDPKILNQTGGNESQNEESYAPTGFTTPELLSSEPSVGMPPVDLSSRVQNTLRARTMQEDMEYMQQRGTAELERAPVMPMPYVPPTDWHASPARGFQTASVPNTDPYGINLLDRQPAPPPISPAPQQELPPAPPSELSYAHAPTQPPHQDLPRPYSNPQTQPFATPPTHEYVNDPYRELPQ